MPEAKLVAAGASRACLEGPPERRPGPGEERPWLRGRRRCVGTPLPCWLGAGWLAKSVVGAAELLSWRRTRTSSSC